MCLDSTRLALWVSINTTFPYSPNCVSHSSSTKKKNSLFQVGEMLHLQFSKRGDAPVRWRLLTLTTPPSKKKLGGVRQKKKKEKKLTTPDNKFFIQPTHPRWNRRAVAAAAAWRVKCVWIWPAANTAEEPMKDAWSHWRGIKNLEI